MVVRILCFHFHGLSSVPSEGTEIPQAQKKKCFSSDLGSPLKEYCVIKAIEPVIKGINRKDLQQCDVWGVSSFKMVDQACCYFPFFTRFSLNEMTGRTEGNKFFKDGRCYEVPDVGGPWSSIDGWMLWRTSPLRAHAGAVSAAEAEVLPPDGGPGSPGEGPGLEVAGRGPSAERLHDLAAPGWSQTVILKMLSSLFWKRV